MQSIGSGLWLRSVALIRYGALFSVLGIRAWLSALMGRRNGFYRLPSLQARSQNSKNFPNFTLHRTMRKRKDGKTEYVFISNEWTVFAIPCAIGCA
jgi:hypothetical protein